MIRWFTQDEEIVEMTKQFMAGSLPGMLMVGMADLQKRWLNIMRITHVAVISNTITLPIHFTYTYIS